MKRPLVDGDCANGGSLAFGVGFSGAETEAEAIFQPHPRSSHLHPLDLKIQHPRLRAKQDSGSSSLTKRRTKSLRNKTHENKSLRWTQKKNKKHPQKGEKHPLDAPAGSPGQGGQKSALLVVAGPPPWRFGRRVDSIRRSRIPGALKKWRGFKVPPKPHSNYFDTMGAKI